MRGLCVDSAILSLVVDSLGCKDERKSNLEREREGGEVRTGTGEMVIPNLCAGDVSEDTEREWRDGESKIITNETAPAPEESFEETLLGMCGKLAPLVINENRKKEETLCDDIEVCASDDYPLLPGLPDHISKTILAGIARESFPQLQLVNKSWKRFLQSEELFELRRQIQVSEALIYVLAENPKATPFRGYDPRTDRWFSLPPTPGHSRDEIWEGFACVSLGSYLYLMGGTRRSPVSQFSPGKVCGDVFRYDAKTNRWSKAKSMDPPRSWFAASVLGKRIYVAGGQSSQNFFSTAQVYDSISDSWDVLPDLDCERSSCRGVTLDGEFWVIGGEIVKHAENYNDGRERGSAEVYNPETDSWRRADEMCLDSDKVAGPIAVANGKLLCVHKRKVWEYDQGGKKWSILGYVATGGFRLRPYPRFGFGFVCLENEIYIIGGNRESWQNRTRCTIQSLDTVEVCNVRELQTISHGDTEYMNLSWRNASPMGTSRGTILATAVVRF